MSAGLRRRFAFAAVDLLCRLLPPALRPWGEAVRHEIAAIERDGAALAFALDSFRGLLPVLAAFHIFGGVTTMWLVEGVLRRPRLIGVACAIGAGGLGIAYLMMAGAPMRYVGINAAALLLGLLLFAVVARSGRGLPGGATLTLGGVLLTTALFGTTHDGAARWLQLGPLFLQPSLILVPLMIVSFASVRTGLATAGMVVAAVALAIQPDRAMAALLAVALVTLALIRPDSRLLLALGSAIAAAAVTIVRPDTLPAVPYVDQILYTAFDVNLLAGLAVIGGAALLVVPALVGVWRDATNRDAYAAFGVLWFAAVIAAALGNYPTPVVGYGGSAVLGYVLSLAVLPRPARTARGASAEPTAVETEESAGDPRIALAV